MQPYHVLFLCTGNSARSILAEVLLNQRGHGRFRAFSAGSRPKGAVHPMTLHVLAAQHLPTDGLRSKSWDEFVAPGAPRLDFVFTVCGNAAGEACPHWPGQPISAHWGVDDPAAVPGPSAEQARAFERALRELDARIEQFVGLPLATLAAPALHERLHAIGRGSGSAT